MKSYRDIILFALVIIGSAAAGMWVLEQNKASPDLQNNDQVQESELELGAADNRIPGYGDELDQEEAVLAYQQQDDSIEKQFEDMLNKFLHTLDTKSQKYKSSRKAITDTIKPENIRAESFLEENQEFAASLVQEMELQMDDIINSFDNADQEIKVLVTAHPEADKDIILDKWKSVKTERMENYMSFFLLEKDFLAKHLEILDLIAQANGQYKVDVMNSMIVFENDTIAQQYEQYLQDIENIKQQEDMIFAEGENNRDLKSVNSNAPQYDEEPQMDEDAPNDIEPASSPAFQNAN